MEDLYRNCTLCPRRCGVSRTAGERGFCGQPAVPRAAWAGLHFGEEPVVTGRGGSGAVFFSGCTLGCSFCQNHQLSRGRLGGELPVAELTSLLLRLQDSGAETVNLVTGTHFIPSIIQALINARSSGLRLPVVWNSSGFELLESLDRLGEVVDIFLPDCKTLDPDLSARLLKTSQYPWVVGTALQRMAQLKPLRWAGDRLRQGVIVRHLVLPGELESTREVLTWFRRCLYGKAFLSLMFQYAPLQSGVLPARPVSRTEYRRVFSWLEALGIDEGYVQEPALDSGWLPDFRNPNPFPQGQARPLWHFRKARAGLTPISHTSS